MTRILRIGYLPLLDAGLLFVAGAKGFDRDEGLAFELHREPSWANLRDKLALGIFDAAHMLAPAVVASTLGLDGFPAPMVGACALGLDGNAITLWAPMAKSLAGDPQASGRALQQLIERGHEQRRSPPRFAHVFPYSTHHYQLLLWLRAGGAQPCGVTLTVTPPPLMLQSLNGRYIDGFCVGEPWNSLAQASGVARILFPCSALTRDCPEKVLAFPRHAVESDPALAQYAARAVRRAALWGEAPENAAEFNAIIADALGEEGVSPELIAAALSRDQGAPMLRLDAAATSLGPAQALWLFVLMALAGQTEASDERAALAQQAFLPFGGEPALPSAPAFFEGCFDPVHWRDALAALRGA